MGKYLYIRVTLPPRKGLFSTIVTSCPTSAASRAVVMPLIPPPTTKMPETVAPLISSAMSFLHCCFKLTNSKLSVYYCLLLLLLHKPIGSAKGFCPEMQNYPVYMSLSENPHKSCIEKRLLPDQHISLNSYCARGTENTRAQYSKTHTSLDEN